MLKICLGDITTHTTTQISSGCVPDVTRDSAAICPGTNLRAGGFQSTVCGKPSSVTKGGSKIWNFPSSHSGVQGVDPLLGKLG